MRSSPLLLDRRQCFLHLCVSLTGVCLHLLTEVGILLVPVFNVLRHLCLTERVNIRRVKQMEKDDDREIHWSNQLEVIIAQEGEKCRGLAWIHQHAESIMSRKNNYIQIPVIVLSTLTGATSISANALFGDEYGSSASKVLGFISIGIGVLNTLGNYFSYAKKSEAHRIAYLHYSKLFSWISVELSLPRDERMTAEDMLKTLRMEMERLAETTPMPPDHILREFAVKFKNEDVSKPAETNGLARINIYRKELTTPIPSSSFGGRLDLDDAVRPPIKIVIPTAEQNSPKHK